MKETPYYVLQCIVFSWVIAFSCSSYQVPEALVEPLSPRGFRVSIPDDPDYRINIFAFHGKINEELDGREAGTFSKDILKAKNGRWVFEDKNTKLKIGDVIYYWTYVELIEEDGRKLGFPRDDQMFTVGELIPNGATTKRPTIRTTTTTSSDGIIFPDICYTGRTLVNNKPVCENDIIFETSFNNSNSINQWQKETCFADAPDNEFVVYEDDPKNIYVKDNVLHIKPSLTNDKYGPDFVNSDEEWNLGNKCTEKSNARCKKQHIAYIILPPVISARMNTKDTFAFKYGWVEIKAKLPKGDWIYPQLFLNPKVEKYGEGYASGQIRIAFLPGNQNSNKKLQGGCVLGASVGGRTFGIRAKDLDKSWADDYHVFSVKWEPNAISVYVDNQMYGKIDYLSGGFATKADELHLDGGAKWHSGTEFAPFDQEMYLTVGVGVGGHSFPDEQKKPWTNNDPKAQLKFYRATDEWHSTWNDQSELLIEYIHVKSLD